MIAPAPLQIAIDTALHGNISAPVWDEVPPGTPAPYVEHGSGTITPGEEMEGDDSGETYVLHVWDDRTSSVRIKQLMAEIEALLDGATLDLGDGRTAEVALEFAEVFKERETDGKRWRHGVMRFRALVS